MNILSDHEICKILRKRRNMIYPSGMEELEVSSWSTCWSSIEMLVEISCFLEPRLREENIRDYILIMWAVILFIIQQRWTNHIPLWWIRTSNIKMVCLLIFSSMTTDNFFLFYVRAEKHQLQKWKWVIYKIVIVMNPYTVFGRKVNRYYVPAVMLIHLFIPWSIGRISSWWKSWLGKTNTT